MNKAASMLLEAPSYGFGSTDHLHIPAVRTVLAEVSKRIDFKDRTKWLTTLIFISLLFFLSNLVVFLLFFFSWPRLIFLVIYGLVATSCYSNLWTHRYCVHRAYRFKHHLARFIVNNLVVKAVSEEIHVISHHVHHAAPDVPGDPYNPQGGFWYCFFADFNHQNVRRDLTPRQYATVRGMLEHTGVSLNSYQQYLHWGTVSSPLAVVRHYLLNWLFWFMVFTLIGGVGLATAAFGALALWSFSYRTLNYRIHGGGEARHSPGRDFHRDDLSINKMLPGFLAGEWHNNHHLYPSSARSGFLWYQLDLPWFLIRCLHGVGAIDSCQNFYEQFYARFLTANQKVVSHGA